MAGWIPSFEAMISGQRTSNTTENKYDRFLDVDREPQKMLQPIEGYRDLPLLQLKEAVQPIESCCPDIQRRADIALLNSKNPSDGLNQNESASIYLYTMEWEPRGQCLYYVLNTTLRNENRQKLKPWLLYLKLILTALDKLPSQREIIWRGIRLDLSQEYEVGQRYIWWSLSSCTGSIGKQGCRTLFNIECDSGKMIQLHSSIHIENEFLLPPATQLEVVGKTDFGAGLTIIHVKQVQPSFILIESPITIPAITSEKSSNKQIPNYPEEYLKQRIIAKNGCLSREGLTDADISYVLQHCIVGKKGKFFDIAFNKIGDKGAQCIGTALQANTSLQVLDMRQNQVSGLGAYGIAKALQSNTTLTTIYLGDNRIGDEGAKYLADVLETNATLKELYLWKNLITDVGTTHLAQALIRNKKLTLLDLQMNGITDEGIRLLAIMLNQNQTLTDLYISENLITNVGTLLLIKSLCSNHGLKVLRIDNLDISNECMKSIENVLQNNYELTQIWLNKKLHSINDQYRLLEIAKRKKNFNILFVP
jgi:hypothetical protein